MTTQVETNPAGNPEAPTPAEIIGKYVESDGPAKGLVHAQRCNPMVAEALAAHIGSTTTLRSPADCDV